MVVVLLIFAHLMDELFANSGKKTEHPARRIVIFLTMLTLVPVLTHLGLLCYLDVV